MIFRKLLMFVVCSLIVSSSCMGQLPKLQKKSPSGRHVTPIQGLEGIGGFNRQAGPKVSMRAEFFVEPGSRDGLLEITCQLNPGSHIYSITQKPGGPQRSRIVLSPSEEFVLVGDFRATPAPEILPPDIFPVEVEEHKGTVTWRAPIQLAEGADPASVRISGELKGQVCSDAGACFQLSQFKPKFEATYSGESPAAPNAPPTESSTNRLPPVGSSESALLAAADDGGAAAESVVTAAGPSELLKFLGFGFVAGLILNLMPCVLPVIGLKVMSFAQQAGENSGRILWLNVCFVAGLITVFMVLAALAAFAGWGWGSQFQSTGFAITLTVIVFIFALSFLGVWEIPIPGFVGSGKAADVAQKEGATGAFAKGVLTTVLATPCGGPLIVPTLAWAVTQPKPSIFAVFFSMGLGMGAPYLLIGLSPKLLKLLPKPGAWMETFKEVMGFVLLATVVWLFTFLDKDYFVPTLALLFASWAACWWVGRIPLTAELGEKLRGYVVGLVFAGVLGFVAFSLLGPRVGEVKRVGFTPEVLADLRNGGTTVLVDFTADW